MIEDVETHRFIATEVRPAGQDDLRHLGPGWKFDWRAEVAVAEVFKLVDPRASDAILGLLGLRRCTNYVEVPHLESHPRYVGKSKKLRGIPGSLLAYAARLSFAIGRDGFISIDAKTNLIEHFQKDYGFQRIGQSQRMFLDSEAAAKLISQYEGGVSRWES
jgi:hypothetical protein